MKMQISRGLDGAWRPARLGSRPGGWRPARLGQSSVISRAAHSQTADAVVTGSALLLSVGMLAQQTDTIGKVAFGLATAVLGALTIAKVASL